MSDESTGHTDGSFYLPNIGLVSFAEAWLPEHKEIVDRWWMKVSTGDENSTLYVKIVLMHLEIPGGWYCDCEFGIDLTYLAGGVWHELDRMFIIAQDHMYAP
ncbi:hypothetical protein FOL47_006863 [Perkinsus chesapeaki]|uniref:Uncharacterized protein n=1 Tax=Perkinsus chesapeaki TaxID=330153 RepID=A0A7J6LPV2_PERCH|nr:hypothetical protein FOL47_006863 [Perkinsus chesapeaki]